MSSNLRRDPVCSCAITDYRGIRLDPNELWLHVSKKTNVAAINITTPGPKADKTIELLSNQFFFDQKVGFSYKINESLMKIIEKSLKTAKIDRKIAESGWI
jgi:hypothetical protein